MNPVIQRCAAQMQLERRLKGRYYRLFRKRASFSATDMVVGRNSEHFTDAEVLALAKQIMLRLYGVMERRHQRRFEQ